MVEQNKTGKVYSLEYIKIPKVFFYYIVGNDVRRATKEINSTVVSKAPMVPKANVAIMQSNVMVVTVQSTATDITLLSKATAQTIQTKLTVATICSKTVDSIT
jgi:hypothetical protein